MSGENETELYQFQLEQVEHALTSDPTNEELLKLQHDLKDLIALTAQYEQATDSSKRKRSPSPVKAPKPSVLVTHQFSVGQEVKAKWSQDGQYYRATITAIGGADQIFSVQFRGYKDIEVVSVSDIEPLEKDKRKGIFEGIKSTTPSTDDSTPTIGGGGNEKKPKEKVKKKVSEVEVKKNAWLNFATGGEKKRKKQKVAPINKKSIFKTPDNPESKVGVVGSGRGMTSYQQRGKHSFTNSLGEE